MWLKVGNAVQRFELKVKELLDNILDYVQCSVDFLIGRDYD